LSDVATYAPSNLTSNIITRDEDVTSNKDDIHTRLKMQVIRIVMATLLQTTHSGLCFKTKYMQSYYLCVFACIMDGGLDGIQLLAG